MSDSREYKMIFGWEDEECNPSNTVAHLHFHMVLLGDVQRNPAVLFCRASLHCVIDTLFPSVTESIRLTLKLNCMILFIERCLSPRGINHHQLIQIFNRTPAIFG